MNIPKTYTQGPDRLDKAWNYWLRVGGKEHLPQPSLEYYEHYGTLSYNTVPRGRGPGAMFENWLYSQGIGVTQINGELYLQFTNESVMTMATLKWT